MAVICDETVNYWWGAQRWGNAKVGLADSRRERDARPAGKQTKAEMTGIKNWDSISSTALHQDGYISSGNSTLNFFRRLSGSSSRVGHSFWFMWIHFIQSPIIAYPCQLLVGGLIWAMLLKAEKLNFGQDFECKGWSKFWSWILINLLYDLKAINLVRTLNPCGRCSFCNVCILWCKVKERNDDAPDDYNNPVHLVHQADLNALAQARVGRWWILRREGRTGNHQHSTLFSTPLPSESIISNILSIFYTFLPSAQGSLSSAKIEFLKVDFGILSFHKYAIWFFLIILCKKSHKEA